MNLKATWSTNGVPEKHCSVQKVNKYYFKKIGCYPSLVWGGILIWFYICHEHLFSASTNSQVIVGVNRENMLRVQLGWKGGCCGFPTYGISMRAFWKTINWEGKMKFETPDYMGVSCEYLLEQVSSI